MKKSESFIKDRILWRASSNKLPLGNCFVCNDENPHKSLISDFNHFGMPVLLFFQNDENWSVIGTTGISGVFEGQYRAVKYSHIVELDGFEAAQEEKTRKSTLSTLKVITREEVFEFKTTPGNEFFSFWSICQMLQRMLAEKE